MPMALQSDDVLGLNRPELINPHAAQMAAALTTPIGPPPPDLSPLLDQSNTMAVPNPKGLKSPGNLPIWNRPSVKNADGTHSSEYSTSFGDDNGEVLVPTIVNGKFLSPGGSGAKPAEGSMAEQVMFDRAKQHYRDTGENLGVFDNSDDADAYADQLHNRGERPLMAGMPSLPQMSAKVKGPSPLDLEEGHINHRLMADYQKDADPYGSPDNHPGFFGKLLHGLNVATGGVNRREFEEKGLEGRLNNVEGDQAKNSLMGAQTGEANSRADLTGKQAENEPAESAARVGEENARTDALNNAPEKQVNLPQLHANAVNKALQEGRDPSTDPTVQHLANAIIGLQPGQNKPDEPLKTIPLQVNGRPHQMGWDAKTGKYDLDQGESGEKPPVVRVETPTEKNHEENQVKQAAFKAYQPAMDSAERFNVMAKNYEDAIKNHDQQAMLSLLANHLGMTMGLQKGARMTKDIINEAKNSTPWLQGLQAKFDSNGYLSGVTLTPQQMQQMMGLAQNRYAEDVTKSRSEARYLGAKDDGPDRVPSRSVMNMYIAQANGDVAKAKEVAAQDGWTVK